MAFCGVQRWVSFLFVTVRSKPRRRPGERSQEVAITEAHTSPTPGIMVWGYIDYDNSVDLVLTEGRLNARQHVERVVNQLSCPS